jgi:N6-L-threonylcarbamoyladenine synthase
VFDGENKKTNDIAASYPYAIVECLISKLKLAVEDMNCDTCVIAGGVAANELLRNIIKEFLPNTYVIFPEISLCTDNAAMVAYLGELYLNNREKTAIDFKVYPNMKLV